MNRDDALTTAGSLINGDRARDYGDARENFGRIAGLLSEQFKHKLTEPFNAAEVAVILTHLKLSRLAVTLTHADSWVDGLGYLALGAELTTGEAGGVGEDSVASETGTKPAEQGFRVGARVRVLKTCTFRSGYEGEIVARATSVTYDWTVKLDDIISPTEFREDELEVIE